MIVRMLGDLGGPTLPPTAPLGDLVYGHDSCASSSPAFSRSPPAVRGMLVDVRIG